MFELGLAGLAHLYIAWLAFKMLVDAPGPQQIHVHVNAHHSIHNEFWLGINRLWPGTARL